MTSIPPETDIVSIGAGGAATSPLDQPEGRHHARLSRALDYQLGALGKEDPLAANLGSMNGGLMRMAVWLDETLLQSMESGPPNLERAQRLLPAIETLLRLMRQVDRFSQLELRTAESRQPKAPNGLNEKLCQETSVEAGPSEDFEV